MLHRMAAPTFTVTATDGKARCGVLQTRNHGDIVTPAALVYTRRGAPLNLTPDMVAQLQPSAKAFQICVMHL